MTTVRTLVRRSDLGLRFLDGMDEQRYGDQPVMGAVQVDPALGEPVRYRAPVANRGLLRAFLILVPSAAAASSGWAADSERAEEFLSSMADMHVAGVVLDPVPGSGTPLPSPWTVAAQRYGVALLAITDTKMWTCAAIHAAIVDEQRRESDHSSDHLRRMQQEAARPGGLMRLLERVSRLMDGYVALVDRSGRALAAFPRVPDGLIARAGHDIERVATKQISSASVSLMGDVIHILPIDAEERPAVLVVGRRDPFTPRARRLVRDAAQLIWMRWRLDEHRQNQEHVEAASRHNREAVLHLLMAGHLAAARRAANALGPELADVVRVYVVECPEPARDEVVTRCDEALGGRAWIVRCPIYTRHVVVLAPEPAQEPCHGAADEDPEDSLSRALRAFAMLDGDVCVGVGLTVPLIDTATGWEQAFHAMTVARKRVDRFARFNSQESLTELLGPSGHRWALARIRPLLKYRPHRPQDPDAAELTETLRSWLSFHGAAAKQLKIHRNTLSSRLRRIERLLECELTDLVTQAELHLALRMLGSLGGQAPAAEETTLDEVLDADQVRQWADNQLRPLLQQNSPMLLGTLRCWLNNNANLKSAAMALGISVPGLRKRLLRIEDLIERSLLAAPSARCDLWIALRVHDQR